jgi:pimeloyl-ACP methyl ester carboxylesterase
MNATANPTTAVTRIGVGRALAIFGGLLVPAAYPSSIEQRAEGAMPKQTSALAKFVFDSALKSDFLFWAAPRLALQAMVEALLATPAKVVESASPDERARVSETLNHLLPFSARRLGVLNDSAITPSLPRYELERIGAPTLIAGAADDPYGKYDGARYSAEHIPNARFIGYPSGGHLLVGHQEEVASEIASFLGVYAQ